MGSHRSNAGDSREKHSCVLAGDSLEKNLSVLAGAYREKHFSVLAGDCMIPMEREWGYAQNFDGAWDGVKQQGVGRNKE